jgi:hypothetical protein
MSCAELVHPELLSFYSLMKSLSISLRVMESNLCPKIRGIGKQRLGNGGVTSIGTTIL